MKENSYFLMYVRAADQPRGRLEMFGLLLPMNPWLNCESAALDMGF